MTTHIPYNRHNQHSDADGRLLTTKEEFRRLNYKFHGCVLCFALFLLCVCVFCCGCMYVYMDSWCNRSNLILNQQTTNNPNSFGSGKKKEEKRLKKIEEIQQGGKMTGA